ncbi:MAG: FkbM family methyltransferase [Planctomycetaceae bacterium]|nr:FkbM family methyltransferase [Planctomycetaceae bacterium]
MKRLVRGVFSTFGLDVRLQSRLWEAHLEEKRLATICPWRKLLRYNPATILDIGANDGHSVRVFRELMPDVTIHSFEPLEDCFLLVEAELKKRPPGRAHHFALGDREETTVIHRSDYTPSSSLLPMDALHREEFPKSASSREEQIQVKRLDDVAALLDLRGPVVAKIDVQGFEDRVIRGGEQTLASAAAVVVELSSYPLYEGQPTFADVHQQLEALGFVFRGTIDQMLSPKDGRILQFDGLFENMKPANQSELPEQYGDRTREAAV